MVLNFDGSTEAVLFQWNNITINGVLSLKLKNKYLFKLKGVQQENVSVMTILVELNEERLVLEKFSNTDTLYG